MTTDTCSTSIPACGELDTSEHGRQKSPLPGQAHPHPAQAEGRVWDRPALGLGQARRQNPEGGDGAVPVLAKFRHQPESLCWIPGSGEGADAALGPRRAGAVLGHQPALLASVDGLLSPTGLPTKEHLPQTTAASHTRSSPCRPEPGGLGPGLCSPRAHTLVVTRTFSLPSRKRSITAALCSTTISPLSRATWWPSFESSAASQLAVLRVWSEKNCFK